MAEHTEASMLALLERRYVQDVRGNGPAWAFVPHVRNAAGFDGSRTMDALAMSLWQSRGRELHGHEIKVSRSDWLRELKDPAKMDAFAALVDRWWLVVADPSIVQEGELPPTWGLMVPRGRGLVVKVPAPKLEGRPADRGAIVDRSFLAALLRAANRTHAVEPAEVTAAVEAARAEWGALHATNIERWREERDQLRKQIDDFVGASGLHMVWRYPAEVGIALRAVLDGESEVQRTLERFGQLAASAERIARDLRKAAGETVA